MKCETRQERTLCDVVQKLGELPAPVGIILIGATGMRSPEGIENICRAFWCEVSTFYPDAIIASEERVDAAMSYRIACGNIGSPVVIDMEETNAVHSDRRHALVAKMRKIGFESVVVACATYYGKEMPPDCGFIANLELREHPPTPEGLDLLILMDDRA